MHEARAEGSEKVTKRRRKAEEDLLRGKKKRARMMEESEVGLSRIRGAEHEEGVEVVEGVTVSSFLDKINQHSDVSTRQLILSPWILDLKLDKV